MTPSRDEDRTLESLLDALSSDEDGASAAPDLELLVGLVEGRLGPAERDAVLRGLESSAEGRRIAAELVDLGEDGMLVPLAPPVTHAPRRPHLRLLTLAALALLAIGAALWAAGSRTDDPPADVDARLLAAAGDLVEMRPDLFGGFRPLDATERAAPRPAPQRGGIRVHRPAATILDARPHVDWDLLAGTDRYQVRILDSEGQVVREWNDVDAVGVWPGEGEPLERGSAFVVEVSADGPLGPMTGQRTFTVATDDDARQYAEAARVIGESPSAELSDLLVAHWAIRRGLLQEAWRVLGSPRLSSSVADETRHYLERQLGLPSKGR